MASELNEDLGFVVAVSVTEDRMLAFIQLLQPDLADTVSKAALMELLQGNGVTYGIRDEALDDFVAQPTQYTAQPLAVAEGLHPVHGEDGSIDSRYNDRGKEQVLREGIDGKVDYRERFALNNIAKGQLIAERQPATKGTPGMTVTGEPIAAKDGKEAVLKLGKNVVADPEKLRMYAVIDGLVTQTEKGKLNVFPVYEVNGDLDYHIGNIDFIGNVVIRGNVLSGFKIKAAGDIRITGGVEGAELESEGSIDIASGIFADGKGYVKAGVNVKCSFIQDANVVAGEQVLVSQSILHSNVRAGKEVICQGSKGFIVGGTIMAGEGIIARTVGNPTSTPTALEVGVAPELREELQELKSGAKTAAENLEKTEKALSLLDQMAASGSLTPDKLQLRTKLTVTKRSASDELANAKERILEIEKSLEDMDKAKVNIFGTVYPGTKVVIGRYTRFIKDATTRVSFQLQEGEITLSSHF